MLQKLGRQLQGKPTFGGGARQWSRSIAVAVAVGIAYFLAARLGLALLSEPERVAAFWPAAGVAAGALLALRRWTRAPVAVAVMVASAAASRMGDRSIWAALSFALCNTGEALLAAWLIERFFGPHFSLDNLRKVLGLLASAAVASAVAAVAAAGAMSVFGPSAAPALSVWWDWFGADALGIITVAPLLIGLAAAVRDAPSWRELIEGTLALVMLAATSHFALGLMSGPCATIASVTVLFPLLLWLGARCRPVFAAAAVFVIAAVIVWTTTYGVYPDPTVHIAHRILDARFAILVAALTALALAALFAEMQSRAAALKDSNDQLRLALDGVELGVWSVDLITGRFESDARDRQINGHDPQAPPKTLAEVRTLVHPVDLQNLDALFAASARTGRSYKAEYRLAAVPGHEPAGRERWVAVEGTVVRGADGRPERLLGVTRDITGRKKAELALAERTVQLALAGKAALVGSFAYDLDTERMQISSGYAAIHGFPDGTTEIARSEWQLGLHPEDRVRLEEIRSRCFRERQDEYGVDYRIVRSESDVRWIDARCFVSYHGDGRPKRVVGVNIDVTGRKRAEEHHRAMNAELDHRVKNVLATVIAIITQTQKASSSLADFVGGLDNRIKSMASTHELLSQNNWRGVPLAEIVRRELAPFATGNAEIAGPSVTLRAEATQAVAMVLHELTTNAAKHGAFSNQSGRVLLRWLWLQNGSHGPLAIEWQEIGGPPVLAPSRSGYGTRIIRELIPYELGGKVDLAFAADGFRCRLHIPADSMSRGSRLNDDSAAASPH
jgi:PAS domain S-box-containing protein